VVLVVEEAVEDRVVRRNIELLRDQVVRERNRVLRAQPQRRVRPLNRVLLHLGRLLLRGGCCGLLLLTRVEVRVHGVPRGISRILQLIDLGLCRLHTLRAAFALRRIEFTLAEHDSLELPLRELRLEVAHGLAQLVDSELNGFLLLEDLGDEVHSALVRVVEHLSYGCRTEGEGGVGVRPQQVHLDLVRRERVQIGSVDITLRFQCLLEQSWVSS